jgi:Derlin-2/3
VPTPAPLQVITPFNVYYNTHLIFKKGEVWRLLTNFFFFGNLGGPRKSR